MYCIYIKSFIHLYILFIATFIGEKRQNFKKKYRLVDWICIWLLLIKMI